MAAKKIKLNLKTLKIMATWANRARKMRKVRRKQKVRYTPKSRAKK
ncbi:MAG TPA: hypothetical protein PLF16_00275 [Candidatus Staskawiczbacteria bacterium]|nr:hypothetical protein [Candidatus Staskawiczbacteria bacterium]